MKIRNLALAGSLAIAGALSAGAASAAPVQALGPALPGASGDAAIEQVYHGHYHKPRICYVPFHRLVHMVGYHRAIHIKRRCAYGYGYGFKIGIGF